MENAKKILSKVKLVGCNNAVIIEKPITEAKPTEQKLAVGDKVKMAKNAPIYGKTTTFKSWVYDSTLYVREIKGSRIVVSTQKTGAVTGAVDKKYLTKI